MKVSGGQVIQLHMIEINDADHVEVRCEEHKVWVNVNGVCMFRAQNVKHVVVGDIEMSELRKELDELSKQNKLCGNE